jgi:hypothetical protein
MAAAGDPAAANVDHEVMALLYRFKEGQNLVIDMIGPGRHGAGWAV